jgi:hypothetical protein
MTKGRAGAQSRAIDPTFASREFDLRYPAPAVTGAFALAEQ